MDADRRNNFINNKSMVVAAPNAIIENGDNNHSAANGTISSSTESSDSVEPPKQSLNDSNKDFYENNVCIEQCRSDSDGNAIVENCTDSNQSNDRDSDVVCSVLKKYAPNSAPYGLHGVNLNSPSSSPVHSTAQQNNHDNNSIDKQRNGDKDCNRSDHQERSSNGNVNKIDCHNHYNNDHKNSHIDGITKAATIEHVVDNADSNGQRINNGSNDIDVSLKSNFIETVVNTLQDNRLPVGDKGDCVNQIVTNPTSALHVQNSSEDCISSTDTISSNSIDVKPIKCPTEKGQAASESEGNGGKKINDTKNTSDEIDEKSQSSKSTMYDDNSLKEPLLGKNSNGSHSTVYSAIDRTNAPLRKGNTDDDCDKKQVAYNEYVNLLCDTDKSGIYSKNLKRKSYEESRPLLRESVSCDDGSATHKVQRRSNPRPRSIVKSPSTQNFCTNGGEKFDVSRKPRLSIQCTGPDPERPVLHVQFLQHHNDSNDSIKKNMFNNQNSPSSGEHESYQNSGSQCDSADRQPEELIHQMPSRGILRTSRLRDSISSSSSGSTSSSSDSSSSDEVSQFAEATPPDGGYGWVVVFAAFMVNMIADGITFSFGVIYVQLLEYFGEGKAKTAWIGSLFMAMPLLSGPIASFLTDRYGCRKVTIIGSLLASIGFFVSAFTDSVEMLCLTFGVFAGFGLSLCYVAAVVIVAYYFDKRRSTATGLSVCGSGIGTFLFAPLTQILIDEYGWRGTTLILAGIFLNMTVCGMLMRDLEWTTYKSKQKAKLQRKRNKLGISADSFSVSNSTNTGGTTSNLHKDDTNGNDVERSDDNNGDNCLAHQTENVDDPRLFSSLITLPTFVKNGEKVKLSNTHLI